MVPGNWQFIPESSDKEKVSPLVCGLTVKDCWEVFLSGQGVFSRVQLILELLQSYVCWGGDIWDMVLSVREQATEELAYLSIASRIAH